MQLFGHVRQHMDVLLELAVRHEEQADQMDRLAIQGIKVDAFFRSTENGDDVGNQIGRGVGNANSEPDAGAHGSLAFFNRGGDGFAMFGRESAVFDELRD